jgi:hypothetical protein
MQEDMGDESAREYYDIVSKTFATEDGAFEVFVLTLQYMLYWDGKKMTDDFTQVSGTLILFSTFTCYA